MVTAKIYAYMLALVVTLWPLFLLLTPMPLFKILLLIALSAALWVLVWKFCDSPQGSFIIGLSIIAATMRSGCADLTIIYVLPYLIVVYLIFIFHTVVGLVRGRQYTQAKWYKFTARYYTIMGKRIKRQ
jgi:hypothetical protein